MPDNPPRTCQTGKKCHTYREAREMINGIRKRNHRVHSKIIPKRAYYCDRCKSYHLTSMGFDEYEA